MPQESYYQIYTFHETAQPVMADTEGEWLEGSDQKVMNKAIRTLRSTAPERGTSLIQAFMAVEKMHPQPDNLILLVDGLPTMGGSVPTKRTVTGKQRVKHYNQAIKRVNSQFPINVILFPIEGDAQAATEFWRLAQATDGAFLSPSRDWP